MKKVLLVNANVNRDQSRTQRLTNAVMERTARKEGLASAAQLDVDELVLEDMDIQPLDSARLNERYALIDAGRTDDPSFALARQWRAADIIVISTPLWLFTYPAKLKAYLEAVDVIGVAYDFLPDGSTKSYCRAGELYYVTTSGGPLSFGEPDPDALPFASPDAPFNLGFRSIQAFGGYECHIPELHYIGVENLDIVPGEAPRLIDEAIAALDRFFA